MTTRPIALVTGASAGIGRALAVALAARGHDLVIVARDAARLAALASELEARHPVHVEVLPADLIASDGLHRVTTRLGDPERPVELLVNNAGFGLHGRFWEVSIDEQSNLVALDVGAVMTLAHAALGPMVERGHGGVINVSSVAGSQPVAGSAAYGASKAFVNSFTHALHEELRGTGVRVMLLAPGFTRTEFHDRNAIDVTRLPDWTWGSAEECAAAALRAWERGRLVCHPRALNAVVATLSDIAPTPLGRRVAAFLTRYRDADTRA